MKANTYQEMAARTVDKKLSPGQIHCHAMFGMVSEIGELNGIYQKGFQGHAIDNEHVKKELGDLLWFIAEFCTSKGWKLEDIMALNIDKLKARYPDGFDPEKSRNRREGDI